MINHDLTPASSDQYAAETSLSGESAPTERRRGPRHEFGTAQAVAPLWDDELPVLADFRRVQCKNLSRGGVAFQWPVEPVFRRVMVMLDANGDALYVTARVVNYVPPEDPDGDYTVCCQFLERIESLS